MEKIPFVVSGEFITNLVRDWLWEEKRPLKVCIDFLSDALGLETTEQKNIAVQILEGRKKLVGNNVFTLEDDNEHVRPLSDLAGDLEKENMLLKIQMDMKKEGKMKDESAHSCSDGSRSWKPFRWCKTSRTCWKKRFPL